MRILFIDTETTGVDPYKARLVELGALLVEVPNEWSLTPFIELGTELRRYQTLVQPEGFDIPKQASEIHGITTDEAWHRGVPLPEALEGLAQLVRECRQSPEGGHTVPGRLVAHNIRYDVGVLSSEYNRVKAEHYPLNHLFPFCTMQAMTERCKLPGRYAGKYKWPRLAEAYAHCFNKEPDPEEFGRAHGALADILVTKEIYLWGLAQGWWTHG